jgi:hypothetical protein
METEPCPSRLSVPLVPFDLALNLLEDLGVLGRLLRKQ